MKNNNVVQSIAENVITTLGFDKLPEKEKEAFKNNLEFQITRRLGLIIAQNLNNDALAKYEKMVKNNLDVSPDEMEKFLEKNMPDYKDKVEQGMDELMKEIIIAYRQ
jgi:hypothetical protein